MARIRKDVSTLGPGWNSTLLWYAKAFQVLWAKPLTDRTSWRYLGAIHGFDRPGWINSNIITNADSLPAASESDVWDQGQHAAWYFLPWHRGYLHAFEDIVATTIKGLPGG